MVRWEHTHHRIGIDRVQDVRREPDAWSRVALRRFREDYSAQVAHKLEARAAAKRAAPRTPSADELAEDAEVSGDEGTFR